MKKGEYKKKIIKECNMPKKEIEEKLSICNSFGMKNKRFFYNRAWELENEELYELNNKINLYMENHEEDLKIIKRRSGISLEEIVGKKFFCNRFGISDKTYFKREIYLIREKDFNNYANALKTIAKNKTEEKEFYTKVLIKRTSWSLKKAKLELKKAEESGVNYYYFVRKGGYCRNNSEMSELVKYIKSEEKRKKISAEQNFQKIVKANNWPISKVELNTRISKSITSCSYEDYYGFEFYKKSLKEQKKYMTLPYCDKLRVLYNEYKITHTNFDIKSNFNKKFSDYIKRTWFINDNLTYEEFEKKIANLSKIIVKPLSSTCGVGIRVFDCNVNKNKNKEIYDYIMSSGQSIIEEYIVQIDEMMSFCPSSVNTVRVTTLVHHGKCIILNGLFRMGNGGVVDNFHANGIAANINVKKGVVDTYGMDVNKKIYVKSPINNKNIKGFKIPLWNEIEKICNELAMVVDDSGFIGWDFALTNKGVDLIEGNAGAYYVVQLLNTQNNKGIKNSMTIYLD